MKATHLPYKLCVDSKKIKNRKIKETNERTCQRQAGWEHFALSEKAFNYFSGTIFNFRLSNKFLASTTHKHIQAHLHTRTRTLSLTLTNVLEPWHVISQVQLAFLSLCLPVSRLRIFPGKFCKARQSSITQTRTATHIFL